MTMHQKHKNTITQNKLKQPKPCMWCRNQQMNQERISPRSPHGAHYHGMVLQHTVANGHFYATT